MSSELCFFELWVLTNRNIGRFATIAEGLPEGKHTVTCELLSETKDPGGGTNFRLISIMR